MFRSLLRFNRTFEQAIIKTNNLQNNHQLLTSVWNKLNYYPSCVQFHTSPTTYRFYEKDRKGGYKTDLKKMTNFEHFKDGFGDLKQEIILWTKELKERYLTDPIILYRPDETDIVWCFDNKELLNNFLTVSDSDHMEGFSSCSLDMSPAGRLLFSGELSTRVPKDGRVKRSGYCSFRSKQIRKSFKRDSSFDWGMYNTLVMKVRGDGRPYILNLATGGYFDVTWNDIHNYVLYTRGGPYWQIAKIPFSKFIFSSKGRLQDKQYRIPLDRITHFGVACGDKVDGRFNLEIEYIGVEFDPHHNEEFAYEMYRTDKNIANE
ncbi:complex I intermediate-associated protein 30 [Arctopsyche grandis]|uniref:complex I intermediate-associated protein 30 n=1 Tax=Arctopsyche grandis TaxID=121162 RepID=UPI00406D968F